MGSFTDENGQFTISGIMVNDTLTISSIKYDELNYYNNGSRLMVIYLPPEKVNDLNSKSPIEVTAVRVSPKTIPTPIGMPVSTGHPYVFVEQEPEFPGGNQALLRYIKINLTYPDKAIENNIEGTVQISFTVQTDGSLNNFSILKGIGYGCDEEILKILAKSPRWKPGIMNGKAVTVNTSVSVKFSLTDK